MAEDLERLRRRRLAGDYPVPFFVRATAEEAASIRANAKAAGLPLSRFLAALGATAGEGQARGLRELREEQARRRGELSGLRYELRKVGINLNQLAHRENAADYGTADPPTDEEVEQATRELRAVLTRVAGALA